MLFHNLRTFQGTGPRRLHPLTHARAAFSAAAALLLAAGAAPGQVTFTKVTDTTSGPFSSFGTSSSANSQAPSLSGSVVAFLANASNGFQGVVTAPAAGGGPLVFPTNGLLLPDGLPIAQILSQPATDGSVVAFVAADFTGRSGVYSAPAGGGGPLSVVADTFTPVPNGSGNFQSFFNEEPSVSGSVVAFTSAPPGQNGIYTGPATGGALARVADRNTAVQPGFGSPSLSGTVVAFNGGTSTIGGIYTGPAAGGPLTPVADSTTAIPNGTGNFSTAFGRTPVVSGPAVIFTGSGSGGQTGVYTGTVGGGSLARVADATTAIPNGSGNFTGFSVVDMSGSMVAFDASGSGQSGIYFEDTAGGALAELIATGDTLDGKTVSTLYFNDGLDGSNIAFTAAFTDGSEGIYVGHLTSVPEPAGLSVIGAGLLGVLGWWRRRSRTGGGRATVGDFG